MSDRRVDSWIGAGTIVSTSLAPVDSGMVRDAGVAGASPPGGEGTKPGSLFLSPNFIHPASDADTIVCWHGMDGWMAVCQSSTTVPSTYRTRLSYSPLSLEQEYNI